MSVTHVYHNHHYPSSHEMLRPKNLQYLCINVVESRSEPSPWQKPDAKLVTLPTRSHGLLFPCQVPSWRMATPMGTQEAVILLGQQAKIVRLWVGAGCQAQGSHGSGKWRRSPPSLSTLPETCIFVLIPFLALC